MTKTKEEPKKKPGNNRIYPVEYMLEKYNLTPDAFRELAQDVLKPKHIKGAEGVTSVGLMMIGKAVKKREKEAIKDTVQAERDAPNVRELMVCGFKPPNKQRLWCVDKSGKEPVKVTVIVSRKKHEGAKKDTMLICERMEEGLFRDVDLDE